MNGVGVSRRYLEVLFSWPLHSNGSTFFVCFSHDREGKEEEELRHLIFVISAWSKCHTGSVTCCL